MEIRRETPPEITATSYSLDISNLDPKLKDGLEATIVEYVKTEQDPNYLNNTVEFQSEMFVEQKNSTEWVQI